MKIIVGAVPMEGRVSTEHMAGILGLSNLCTEKDVEFAYGNAYDKWRFLEEAQANEADYLMLIDGDIGFNPPDIFTLIESELDVVGGCVPKKEIDYDRLRNVLLDGVPAQKAVHAASQIEFVPTGNAAEFEMDKPTEVEATSAAFVLISKMMFGGVKFTGNMVTKSKCPVHIMPKVFVLRQGMTTYQGCMFCSNGMYMHFEEME
jgi:hypothetical protein